MKVGVPREIKRHEYRIGLTPDAVQEFTTAGHQVLVEAGAGAGIGASDDVYRQAGAEIIASVEDLFARSEMIVKVKEPQPAEWGRPRPRQTLFTYLHLAPDREQAQGLLQSGCTAVAYETVTGCFETSRPTTHDHATYEVDGIIHYCMANMPGAVPLTSSHALNHATLPFGLALAKDGIDAIRSDIDLQHGLNVHRGKITNEAVALSLGLPFVSPAEALRDRSLSRAYLSRTVPKRRPAKPTANVTGPRTSRGNAQ
jgi:alanine dehydrogenase